MTQNLDELFETMLENACDDFNKSDRSNYLREREKYLGEALEGLLACSEKEPFEEFMLSVLNTKEALTKYVYRRGFRDCVKGTSKNPLYC